MSGQTDNEDEPTQKVRSLKAALETAKNRVADRSDAVIDLRVAEQARLALLADELRPMMLEIDETDERFDFALTKGERPRLWIDMTTFVSMGQDKRTYRFLKDTRMGRMVLAETSDHEKTADIVSEYVAEKVLERERIMEGEWESLKDSDDLKPDDAPSYSHKGMRKNSNETKGSDTKSQAQTNSANVKTEARPRPNRGSSLFWFMIGLMLCLAILALAAFIWVPQAH